MILDVGDGLLCKALGPRPEGPIEVILQVEWAWQWRTDTGTHRSMVIQAAPLARREMPWGPL